MPKNRVIKSQKQKISSLFFSFFSDRDLYTQKHDKTAHKASLVLMSSFLVLFVIIFEKNSIDSIITKKMFVSFSSLLVVVLWELLRRANIAGAISIRSSRIQVSIDG